ncbi:MAG: urate hydroxylase PuuD, partial [Rhodospirillaceae bacterium]
KWESYATWLSGFALLAVVYYMGADLYLIDARKLDVSAPVAILLSIASLFIGWIAYDRVCKSKFGDDNTRLMLFLFVVLVVLSWGFDQIFSDRAALLHLGALTATIMSGNVFRVIIPNQTIVVEDLKAGRVPDAKYGKIAKQRSTHNNYLTLPVLFFMLSNHYPLAFASEYNWIIAALVFLMGVTIRHFFNTMHAGGGKLWWTWGVTTGLFVAIMALSMAPLNPPNERDNLGALPPAQQRFVEAEGFDEAYLVVVSRCSMCHGEYPAWDNLRVAPKGVVLETEGQIAAHAHEIFLQAGVTHAMPPSNITEMEPEERDAIVAWYRAAQ